jgi:signal transduction histidine kinase/DNA-binding response OmpR family regulator/ligand-binding sensor domain-containing protein
LAVFNRNLLTYLIISLLFLNSGIKAQENSYPYTGLPIIKNYLPKDYRSHNQNWAIVQDNRGIMYFGNSNGVLVFDGETWNKVEVPNEIVRSLGCDSSGTVFVGSADDFGFLSRETNGTLVYKSLLKFTGIKEAVGHIWHTFSVGNKVFFITNWYIFQLTDFENHPDKPVIKIFRPENRIKSAFRVNNDIYILEASVGLLKYSDSSFIKIQGSKFLSETNVYSMLPYDENGQKILIAEKTAEMFLFDGRNFQPFRTEAHDFLVQKKFFSPGAKLPDGSFVFNTSEGGIIIINHEGKLLRKVDVSDGLADDGVLFVYYSNGKLWLALQNGISLIDMPSPISIYNQSLGLKGTVSDIKIINNILYAATTWGIYYKNLKTDINRTDTFNKITDLREGWSMIRYDHSIIIAVTNGVYFIKEKSTERLNSLWKDSYFVYQSKYFKDRVYVGLQSGLAVLDKINGKWTDRGKIRGINTAVRQIAEDNYNNLWLGTPYAGVYKVSNLTQDLESDPVIDHISGDYVKRDEEVKIFPVNDKLFFTAGSKILVYNYIKKTFEPEKNYGLNAHLLGAQISYLLQDSSGTIWVAAVQKSSYLKLAAVTYNDNKYLWHDLSFLENAIDFSNPNAVFTIYRDENMATTWFGGSDGIVSFKSDRIDQVHTIKKVYSTLIRKVSLGSDSLIFAGDDAVKNSVDENINFRLPYTFNTLRFEFASLNYDNNLSVYQYKLEGLDNNWSAWTSESKKDYTNLPSGNYVFRVRSKSIYNIISDESDFTFTVLSPWYLTWYAYLIYILLLSGLFLLTIRLRFKYLTQKNLKLEAIIDDRTEVIRNQAEKLKVLDEVKSRFFTNISHEFRTPLTLTLGQIEAVKNSLSDNNLKNKLDMGYRNAKKLLKLINQILEISKIEAGKHKLKVAEADIVRFVRHLFFSFESIADQKGLSLKFYSEKEKIDIFFDPEKIEKVFNNLISNAIKFTPEGGSIELTIQTGKELSLEEKDIVQITLKDTGIGIPPERIPYVFDRFYQVERTERSELEGTGIGLTLVKELIELHSGSITVESTVNKGTKFTVSLLTGKEHFTDSDITFINQIDDSAPEEDQEVNGALGDYGLSDETSESEEISESKESVLIIDDNSDIRSFISEQLEGSYAVYQAADGMSGLVEAKEKIPDLIITDVRMPGMDGFEVSRKLKEDTLTSHIPVIILTAKADQSDKLKGLETGADDYLVKPFNQKELMLRVRNLISIRKRLREKYRKTTIFDPKEVSSSSLDQKFLENVVNEINKNLSNESFNSERLASLCAISVSQLNRKLNALIGQPAGHLIRSSRMEKAAQMLINHEASIKETGFLVGFSDQSNFARSFKKYFGKSPGEFTDSK